MNIDRGDSAEAGCRAAAAVGGFFGCCSVSQSATAHAQFQTAMIGLSWRFAPDGSGSPWAGGYGGLHGGSAWGNNASAVYNGVATNVGN
jgi:hypothetical protein